ncbi:MAG TPA: FkbM family methyltransferase [Holophagaceae bacterium]|nr:FkbM family methyltransferase [Holophagaceae bacterium]
MKLASMVYRRLLASKGVQKKLWSSVRKRVIKLWDDPPCVMTVHGMELSLPLSHSLPIYLSKFPFYDRLPRRLSEFIHKKHGRLSCIDVGANVGDTIASFRLSEEDVFLAVEPNPKFNKLLRENWGTDKHVTIVEDICSSGHEDGRYAIQEQNGTASIVQADEGAQMSKRPLDEIVGSHPELRDANLLKIDTDGHDFEVLEGAWQVIKANAPAVLFECDAFGNADYVANCLKALRKFHECGYNHFILYNNFGNLMGRYPLGDLGAFRNLLFLQLTSDFYYFDVLVMKDEDLDQFHESEVEFFVGKMPNPHLRSTALAAAGLPQ